MAVGVLVLFVSQTAQPRALHAGDPLTISLSSDGASFECVYSVRANSGLQYFLGWGKGAGYQYPGAAVVGDWLLIVYSINKEVRWMPMRSGLDCMQAI